MTTENENEDYDAKLLKWLFENALENENKEDWNLHKEKSKERFIYDDEDDTSMDKSNINESPDEFIELFPPKQL